MEKTKWKSDLHDLIDNEDSTYTNWEYLETVLEWLRDYGCLTKKGEEFQKYVWNKYLKDK